MNLIVAMTKKRVIGRDNKLIWHIPEDLKNFKRLTTGSTVIMGRKTHQSILNMLGKPLPGRSSIILSRLNSYEGVKVCRSIQEAVIFGKELGKEIFFIGGESIYEMSIPYIDTMYISWVKQDYEGDAYFPDIDFKEWNIRKETEFSTFTFTEYNLKQSSD